jgi:hypothetical protein
MNAVPIRPDFDDHEQIVMLDDPPNGVSGVVCISLDRIGALRGRLP